MSKFLNNIINSNNNYMTLIGFLVTILTVILTAYFTNKNNKKKTTTQYFKEKGIEIQEKILRFWCGLFYDDFQIMKTYHAVFNNKKLKNDVDVLKQVQKDSYVYCSSRTINSIKDYQQYLYSNQETKKTRFKFYKQLKSKQNFLNQFILISRIISRMKYDFTGEKVDELVLIKMRINDLNFFTRFLFRCTLWYYNIKENIIKLISILILFIIFYKLINNV